MPQNSRLTPIVVGPVNLDDMSVDPTRVVRNDAGFHAPSIPICAWCQSSNCDGTCRTQSHRSGTQDLAPVVQTQNTKRSAFAVVPAAAESEIESGFQAVTAADIEASEFTAANFEPTAPTESSEPNKIEPDEIETNIDQPSQFQPVPMPSNEFQPQPSEDSEFNSSEFNSSPTATPEFSSNQPEDAAFESSVSNFVAPGFVASSAVAPSPQTPFSQNSKPVQRSRQQEDMDLIELRAEARDVMMEKMFSVKPEPQFVESEFSPVEPPVCEFCHVAGCTNPDCGRVIAPAAFEQTLPDSRSDNEFQPAPNETNSTNDFAPVPSQINNDPAAGPSNIHRENAFVETLQSPLPTPIGVIATRQEPRFQVSNPVFCMEVSGFSQFKPFPTTQFRAGQKLLIYCEVENQHSTLDDTGENELHKTRLQGRYVIFDSEGRAVEQFKFPVVEDIAGKRRRDFYMYFPIKLGELPSGDYRLKLSVEDMGNHQSDSIESGLEFHVE